MRTLDHNFTVYIDESGEPGVAQIRGEQTPGASPYFALGAVVCIESAEVMVRNLLSEFKQTIRKKSWKHATELKHAEKVLFARQMSTLPQRYFCVISNKSTLGGYKDFIDADAHKFYNKCAKYLLECVCSYLGTKGVRQESVNVVFEERNHDYDALRRYLTIVRDKPIYPQSRSLKLLNPFSISTRRKGEEDMLEFADFVAYSAFQCTNKSQSNYFIPEPRYFKELSRNLAANSNGSPLGVGLKCIHSLKDLQLDKDVEDLFLGIQAKKPTGNFERFQVT